MCNAVYVEVEESGAGYCLDAVTSDTVEAWDIGQRLRGHMPSDLERRVFELEVELAAASEAGDADRVEELAEELEQLWAELTAGDDS